MTQLATPRPDSAQSVTRMARGGTANLVGAGVTALCTFALTVVVTRGVSRADAGVFFSVTSLFIVASIVGQLGTQTGLVYFISRCRALGRPQDMDGYLRIALRPMLAMAVVMAVATLVFAHPLAELTVPRHVDQATTYLRVLACFIPIAGLEASLLSATRGLGSMRAYLLIEQLARPLAQVLLVFGATLAVSAPALGIAWAIGYLPAAVAALLAWRALRGRYPRADDRAADGPSGREFWRFSAPRALTSVLQMLMQRFDIVLVGALAGAVDAAIYAAATRFIVLGQLGTNALTLAAQPQFAHRLSAGDHRSANELYQVSTAWLVLITWPVYLTLVLFSGPLLRVFGHGYQAGGDVMLLLSLSMLIATGLGMVDTVLSMAGHTSWNLANAALALAVNIGLDVWLIPIHGIVGAAIGWAVAIAVRNLAAVTQVAVSLHYHPFARATMLAFALAVLCYFVIAGAARVVVGANPTGLAVGLVLATGCYLAGVWALRGTLRLDALQGLRRKPRTP